MRQAIVGFGAAIIVAIGAVGLAGPAAAQQFCASEADGTPCGEATGAFDFFKTNSICRGGECVVDIEPSPCAGVVCDPGLECLLGRCVPSSCDTVTCTALDQCHEAGVCVPPGTCTTPQKLDGSSCDDGDAGTTGDRCVAGTCVGDPAVNLCAGVVCPAPGVCRLPGTCDPATGTCTTPHAPVRTPCVGGELCSFTGGCGGFCDNFQIDICSDVDQCAFRTYCDPINLCVAEPAHAGTTCDDGDPATADDMCDGEAFDGTNCMGMTVIPAEPLDLTRAMIQARSRGNVRVEGTVPIVDLGAGLILTVMDGLGLSVTGMVGPDDCRTRARSGRIKCVFRDPADRRKQVRLRLKPSQTGPNLVDFDLFMNKIDAAQPLDGPVKLTIEEPGGTTYEGSIATCQMQALKLKCS